MSTTFNELVVFADESGDHSLVEVDSEYPVFVLSLCLFDKSLYTRKIVPRFQKLKFDFFGHDTVIFHERDIRKQNDDFAILTRSEIREPFFEALNEVVRKSRFKIIASVIDKRRLKEELFQDNPYGLALRFCLEKCYSYVSESGNAEKTIHCIFEQRGRKEDKDLELEFLRITSGENQFRKELKCLSLRFADKKTNSTGMQIADLTARPIGLSVLRPHQANRAFDIIRSKIIRDKGDRRGHPGLKIFP